MIVSDLNDRERLEFLLSKELDGELSADEGIELQYLRQADPKGRLLAEEWQGLHLELTATISAPAPSRVITVVAKSPYSGGLRVLLAAAVLALAFGLFEFNHRPNQKPPQETAAIPEIIADIQPDKVLSKTPTPDPYKPVKIEEMDATALSEAAYLEEPLLRQKTEQPRTVAPLQPSEVTSTLPGEMLMQQTLIRTPYRIDIEIRNGKKTVSVQDTRTHRWITKKCPPEKIKELPADVQAILREMENGE